MAEPQSIKAKTAIRRSSSYFEDGDIVLSLEKGKTTQIFRVHRALLSHHSPVFRDMLSLGAQSNNAKYDGVPIVHIPDDDADDFAELVRVLYDPSALYLKLEKNNPDLSLLLTGLMSLAEKYLIETIRTTILTCVKSVWPTTLEEWDHIQASINLATKSGRPSERIFHEPLAAIGFANRFNVSEVLPAAFYLLSITNMEHGRDGRLSVTLSDTDPDTDTEEPMPMQKQPSARWSALDRQGLLQFMMGRDRLYNAAFELIYCGGFYQNHSKPAEEFLHIMAKSTKTERRMDPVAFLKTLAEKPNSELRSRFLRAREALWDKLPQFFDLSI
ncbi:hypothetical protein PHLCEN_2v12864 [Hermanssonia centrifuga]|uniref:BTB domain-containing protein n=1 Tax=Hermanssonia centrifuga TaxID=98765 RepID=A0A2R6NFQ6_9APHY|nr:hypothetical protein PHLCEN_2v12864 [Hermanssonia centrifuga]